MPRGYFKNGNNGLFKKGHKPPVEWGIKQSKRMLGSTGFWKGKKLSEDHIKKMSDSHVGVPLSEKHKLGLRLTRPKGAASSSWKGGISKIDKLCRKMPEYIQWRSDCFTRDNWTCQTCRITGVYLTVHHKKGFSKIIKENNIKNILDARKCGELWDITNGVTLCEECHKLTDNYKGRGMTHLTNI